MSRQPRAGDMQQMLKQVQKMQKELQAAQERLKQEVVEASAGGGMVSVQITGDFEVKSVQIDPAAVDPDDVELLAEMVQAAFNEAMRKARELAERSLGGATSGMDLDDLGGLGGLGLPGL
jgi:nucleoid-associated protein EbfC